MATKYYAVKVGRTTGKFKPWIFIGVILNSLIIICLFTVRSEGWGFVAEYMGKSARIVLVDQSKEGWGFINADCFYQSDTKLENKLLHV